MKMKDTSMWLQINFIKWTFGFSLLFLALTYFASVNSELGIIKVNSGLISNNFFFALFGGAFASSLVVLISECYKYLAIKANTEEHMFICGAVLYKTLLSLKQSIINYQSYSKEKITAKQFDIYLDKIQNDIYELKETKYVTFFTSHNRLFSKHRVFCDEIYSVVQSAISETQSLISQIDTEHSSVKTLPESKLQLLINALDYVDDYVLIIDQSCNNRFDWMSIKDRMTKDLNVN